MKRLAVTKEELIAEFFQSLVPSVILVKPQISENIGTAARAMLNCGLHDLRILKGKGDHLSEKAISASSGADILLEKAKIYKTLADAVNDMNYVVATTARRRDMVKTIYSPEKVVEVFNDKIKSGQKCALVFGPERTGLDNDDIALCDAIVEIPLNPIHPSLNLAQAVLLMGYEWYKTTANMAEKQLYVGKEPIAEKGAVLKLFEHLETELENRDYFKVQNKKTRMQRSIRNIFGRIDLTEQEIRTLHGVISHLIRRIE